MKSTTTRQEMGGTTITTVVIGRMVAYGTGERPSTWTVTIGRNVLRCSALGLRVNRSVLRRSTYARALYRAERGLA